MAIPHLSSGQPINIRTPEAGLPHARTIALFKTDELEVIHLILPVGRSFPSHKVHGEITIQCLEGEIEVTADGQTQVLHSDQLLYLSGGVLHSLLGLQDASALLTIVLRK